MCSCSHAISAKEKSSAGIQQMAKSIKCSLVTPKTQYFNSAFSNCCVSWIWSQAFCPFLQATKFNTAHLVLVAVFWGTNSLPRAACIALSTNWHWLSLSFGTLSFNFFLSGFHLGTSLSVELLSLNLVHSPIPKWNRSWRFLERFWIFAESEGEIKSMTHYSRRAT